jgi:uncharacterized protein with HEPN domain
MSDAERLADILERIDRIRRATSDGRSAFFDSDVIQDAVIRNLEVIGEAAKHVSASVRRQSPDVPWREMSRFRDLAIHHYGKVLADEVWAIVEKDLGPIRRAVQGVNAGRSG